MLWVAIFAVKKREQDGPDAVEVETCRKCMSLFTKENVREIKTDKNESRALQ